MLQFLLDWILITLMVIDGLILFWQLMNYLFRPQDRSRLHFLLLVAGFCLFNLITMVHLVQVEPDFALFLHIFLYSYGVIFATYFFYYISKELDIMHQDFKLKMINTRHFFVMIILAVPLSALTTFMIIGHFKIAQNIVIPIPFVVTLLYCGSLANHLFRVKAIKVEQSKRLLIYSGFAAILLISAMPMAVAYGNCFQLYCALINISFLFTIGSYVHKLYREDRDERSRLSQLSITSKNGNDLSTYGLTPREFEVALLILQGLKYKRIGDALNIAEVTVRTHARAAFQKTKTGDIKKFRKMFASYVPVPMSLN